MGTFYRFNDFIFLFQILFYAEITSQWDRFYSDLNPGLESPIHTDYTHTFLHWPTVFMSSQMLIGQSVCVCVFVGVCVFQGISVQGRSVVIEPNLIWSVLAGWFMGTLISRWPSRTCLFIHLNGALHLPAGLLSNAISSRGSRSQEWHQAHSNATYQIEETGTKLGSKDKSVSPSADSKQHQQCFCYSVAAHW